MRLFKNLLPVISFSAILLLGSVSAFAQSNGASQVPVTVTVTVLGDNFQSAPPIPQEDVTVHSGKSLLKVTAWQPAQNSQQGALQLAILIDDDVRTSLLAQQMGEIANFIENQPETAYVGVFYADHGSAYPAAPFTTNHDQAARALRLTLGRNGESPSVYLSLADLASHWPSNEPGRREVLLFCSGTDILNPGIEDPYFDSAVDAVQKAGLNVHAIYVAGLRYTNSFQGEISGEKLIQVTDDTGGHTFNEAFANPVSFAPYLTQMNQVLNNQYSLTFLMDRSKNKKGELRPVEIRLEEHGVKISAPHDVFVPGP
jgi:hypothetical protein